MPASNLTLLPCPRRINVTGEPQPPARDGAIVLVAPEPSALLAIGKIIQDAVQASTGWTWPIIAASEPLNLDGVTVLLDPKSRVPAQGYELTTGRRSRLSASDPAGLFYGAQTFKQILRQSPDRFPVTKISDHPDFAARGVMMDISRDKVPTMETLFRLVDLLAEMKINQFQLYTEHTFAYRKHPLVWAEADPMTGEQILALDAYCRERFIELVPNQNSFSHMERWLKHPKYLPLAECPDGAMSPWNTPMPPFGLAPENPGSIALVESLFDELLPFFTSKQINVGADETFDLGFGASKAICEKRGKGRVYIDFILKIHRLLKDRGRKMQFWGDIIIHYPELVKKIPKDVIALEWGYAADHPFNKHGKIFADSGATFYVCPGTSSWQCIGGRTDAALPNLRSAAENGLKHGAVGYLNTDWGDFGHLQYLPISFLPFAAGAAQSWCHAANRDDDFERGCDVHVFRDRAGVMGRFAAELGRVYKILGKKLNDQILFWILTDPDDSKRTTDGVSAKGLAEVEARLDALEADLDRARMQAPDATVIEAEFRNAIALLRHACHVGQVRLDPKKKNLPKLAAELQQILGEHRRLWIARNRPGGLVESTKFLVDRRLDGYLPKGATRLKVV